MKLIPILVALTLSGCGFFERSGITPLIGAVRAGDLRTARELLRNGADPNLRGGVNDWTPLMHAVHKNQRGTAVVLLENGADVNARDNSDGTALMMAAGYGYGDIVRELLNHGADPYLKTHGGQTALSYAMTGVADIDRFTAGHCQGEAIRALLKRAPELQYSSTMDDRAAKWLAHREGCL